MRHFIVVFVLAALPAASLAQPRPWPECYCTDSVGDRVEMGQVICLSVGGRAFQARCEMSQNVPMWREIGDGCVSG